MACLRHSFGVFGAWGHHAIWNVVPMALNSLCDNRMLSEIACRWHSGPGHERHDAIWDKLTMELSWWTECLHPSSLNSSGALIIQLYLQYPIISTKLDRPVIWKIALYIVFKRVTQSALLLAKISLSFIALPFRIKSHWNLQIAINGQNR